MDPRSITTRDKLLGGRFVLEQPADGYRVAVDTFLVASAVPALSGMHILDLGCGAGGIMLALAARTSGVFITGVEIQPELMDLCRKNIDNNGFIDFLNVRLSDATKLDNDLHDAFDCVVMNPPFHDTVRHDASPIITKRIANANSDMKAWIVSAHAALKNGGNLTMIVRADRQNEVLVLVESLFGAVSLKPIQTKADGTCKRLIVRAVKGGAFKITLRDPFVLTSPHGGTSEEGENILRHAHTMLF